MKQYVSENNAPTVTTVMFCSMMTIVSALRQTAWQVLAFTLAFSFYEELTYDR